MQRETFSSRLLVPHLLAGCSCQISCCCASVHCSPREINAPISTTLVTNKHGLFLLLIITDDAHAYTPVSQEICFLLSLLLNGSSSQHQNNNLPLNVEQPYKFINAAAISALSGFCTVEFCYHQLLVFHMSSKQNIPTSSFHCLIWINSLCKNECKTSFL